MQKKLIVLLSLVCACFIAWGAEPDIGQLRKKAEAGDAEAQYNLAGMYAKGWGVPQDDKEAVKWLRLAADQGGSDAQFGLGMSYAYGNGVPRDDKEAVKWLRKAADQGYALAQSSLGVMYCYGKGVPQDYVQSYAWYNLAGANGYADAKLLKADLAKKMTPDQIARAQELSKELYKKINAAKKIAQQEVTIQALQDQLKQQKARAAQAVSPSHRLGPDRPKSSGSNKSPFRLSGPRHK
jgi:TPR repeat protein